MINQGVLAASSGGGGSGRLTRSVAGLISQDDFASFAGWTVGANWSIDASVPALVSWASPIILLPRAGAESETIREATPLIISDVLWYVFYDSSDGIAPWTVHLAKSTDQGVTWTRLGSQTSINHGTGATRSLSGYAQDGGDGFFYLSVLNATALTGTIPDAPYYNSMYRCTLADIEADNWQWLNDSPALGGGGSFDSSDHTIPCIVNIGGVLHAFASTANGNLATTDYTTGNDTLASFNAVIVKDGLGAADSPAINNVTTGSRAEVPKVWHQPEMVSWIKAVNAVGVGAASDHTVANDFYIVAGASNVAPDYQAAGAIRQRFMFEGATPVVGPVGYIAPLIDRNGNTLKESDGSIGYFFDGNTVDHSPHDNRDLLQGQIELALSAAAIVDPVPGQGLVSYPITKTVTNADFIQEWTVEFSPGVVPTNWECGVLYRASGNDDTDWHGYNLAISGEPATNIILYRLDVGYSVFSIVGQVGPFQLEVDPDARNKVFYTYRLEVTGNVHQLYINGGLVLNVTDGSGSAIATGPKFGFRSVGAVAKVRKVSLRKSSSLTITGCPAGATGVLRGANKVVFDVQTADGGGNLTLSSPHFPMYSASINGVSYLPPLGSLLWGGDVLSV